MKDCYISEICNEWSTITFLGVSDFVRESMKTLMNYMMRNQLSQMKKFRRRLQRKISAYRETFSGTGYYGPSGISVIEFRYVHIVMKPWMKFSVER